MAGNHNSGRRKDTEEEFRKDILKQAWKLTHTFFANKDIPMIEKQKVATQLVVKDITLKQSIEGGDLTKVIIAYADSAKCSDTNRIGELIPS